MKYITRLSLSLICLGLLAGCATQPMVQDDSVLPGFWAGLWHGSIAWLAVIGHIFNPQTRIYEFPNNGGWYDFGFIVGGSSIFWAVLLKIWKAVTAHWTRDPIEREMASHANERLRRIGNVSLWGGLFIGGLLVISGIIGSNGPLFLIGIISPAAGWAIRYILVR